MYKKLSILLMSLLILCTGCQLPTNQQQQMQRLQAEKDSLIQVKITLEEEVNAYFATLNSVQKNIGIIKNKQHILSIQPLSENTPKDIRTRVSEDMDYLDELIRSNQDELHKLNEKLSNSSLQLANMRQTILQLTQQLNEEKNNIKRLQRQLYQKEALIDSLKEDVNALGKDIDTLNIANKTQQQRITEQQKKIHTVWYAIGSRKELKQNNIITTEGIFSSKKILQADFNKAYFVQIDAQHTHSIPLYTSKKAKVLTHHPISSYTLKKENDNYTLIITDTKAFWEVSKYLVIEIN